MAAPVNPRNVEFRLADDGEHVEIWHDCTERRNQATLPLGRNGWNVQQKDPLTVAPSVQCGDCGLHGWISGGTWWQ